MLKAKKNNNEGFDNLRIILLIHEYALAYVRLNRKGRLKNMRGAPLEVVKLADASGAYIAISSVNQCVTGPL